MHTCAYKYAHAYLRTLIRCNVHTSSLEEDEGDEGDDRSTASSSLSRSGSSSDSDSSSSRGLEEEDEREEPDDTIDLPERGSTEVSFLAFLLC